MNQSRAEEITMREDYGSLNLPHHDEGFGDLEFNEDAPELLRDDPHSSAFGSASGFDHPGPDRTKDTLTDDGFGGPLGDGQDMMGKNSHYTTTTYHNLSKINFLIIE